MGAENTAQAVAEFEGFLAELPTCSRERRDQIYREACTCDDLMNYSPMSCWEDANFRKLRGLVHQTFVAYHRSR